MVVGAMARGAARGQKTFGFGLRAFKKAPELLPLVAIVSIPCALASVYVGYALATKQDVVIDKTKEIPPWERVESTEYNKFLTINRKYMPNNELDSLRKEIGSYKI